MVLEGLLSSMTGTCAVLCVFLVLGAFKNPIWINSILAPLCIHSSIPPKLCLVFGFITHFGQQASSFHCHSTTLHHLHLVDPKYKPRSFTTAAPSPALDPSRNDSKRKGYHCDYFHYIFTRFIIYATWLLCQPEMLPWPSAHCEPHLVSDPTLDQILRFELRALLVCLP